MKNLFEYPVPFNSDLREDIISPYRFSEELVSHTIYMFQHPNFEHRDIFIKLHLESDAHDMLKSAYLITRNYQLNPQHFGHALNHVVPQIVVNMWKCFLGLHKILRGVEYDRYYKLKAKYIHKFENKFMDILLDDMKKQNLTYHNDDMVKRRVDKYGKDVGLRDRIMYNEPYTDKEFEELCDIE